MSSVYVIKNQEDAFLDKSGDWASGLLAKTLYRTPHKDEAINQKVDITVKQPDQRLTLLEVNLNEQGVPVIPEEYRKELDLPPQTAPEEPTQEMDVSSEDSDSENDSLEQENTQQTASDVETDSNTADTTIEQGSLL